jgi:5-methylcytosine-specific restriction endonuclease McrA
MNCPTCPTPTPISSHGHCAVCGARKGRYGSRCRDCWHQAPGSYYRRRTRPEGFPPNKDLCACGSFKKVGAKMCRPCNGLRQRLPIPDAERRERSRAYYRAYNARNAERRRQQAADYARRHPERYIAYRQAHPERMREHDQRARVRRSQAASCDHAGCSVLGPLQLAWQTNPHQCWMCGRPVDIRAKRGDPAFLHMDHVMALARGGLHCADNLRPACAPCNQRKGARLAA